MNKSLLFCNDNIVLKKVQGVCQFNDTLGIARDNADLILHTYEGIEGETHFRLKYDDISKLIQFLKENYPEMHPEL
jgi:hypothetical protein